MKKLLIVEDEYAIRRGIAETVNWRALGYETVIQASNGLEGLETAQKESPDLIITDVKMPKMDGLEMIAKLRESDYNGKIIILTAYDTFNFVQKAIRLGAVDYLLKPFHDGDLEEAVMRISKDVSEDDSVLEEIYSKNANPYIKKALDYIDRNYAIPDISITSVAEQLEISEGHLSHIFKKETGCTLLYYITRRRVCEAQRLLHDSTLKVYEVAEKVGYKDTAYFSNIFKKYTGDNPTDYQKKQREH